MLEQSTPLGPLMDVALISAHPQQLIGGLTPANRVSQLVKLTASLSPAAVAAGTSAEQTLAFLGLLAGDIVLAVIKPTAQAGLSIGGWRVPSAGNIAITFVNTPQLVRSATASISPAQVAANTSVEQIFAVTGAAAGDGVLITKPTVDAGISIGGGRVSSAGNVGICFVNSTAAPITPTASQIYLVELIRSAIITPTGAETYTVIVSR